MQYQEFLRLSGATREECTPQIYQRFIEPAYMENDLLFPTKEAVVEHWHRFGLLGFTKDSIASLTNAVHAIQQICKRAGRPHDGMAQFANFVASAASNN